jgi:hypothetical protein
MKIKISVSYIMGGLREKESEGESKKRIKMCEKARERWRESKKEENKKWYTLFMRVYQTEVVQN